MVVDEIDTRQNGGDSHGENEDTAFQHWMIPGENSHAANVSGTESRTRVKAVRP
jgi:hypothetical protein